MAPTDRASRRAPSTSWSAAAGPHDPFAYRCTGGGESSSGCIARQPSSTLSCRAKRLLSPIIAAWSSTSYGVAPSPPWCGELHVEGYLLRLRLVGALRVDDQPDPGGGVQLDDELVRLRAAGPDGTETEPRRALEDEPHLRLRDRQMLARADEERHTGPAPVVDSQAERSVGLRRRVRRDAVDPVVALVLPAHVVAGPRPALPGRPTPRRSSTPSRRRWRGLHCRCGHHLHQVVDDYVANRADGVVEVAAILDPEALGHGDLHRAT